MPSYWGQEKKPCPACGSEILAAAVRCRNCGAVFSSTRPQTSAEYRQGADLSERRTSMRGAIIWIFLLCVIPFLSPVGVIAGLIWFALNRQALRSGSALYAAMLKIGIGIGAILTVLLIVFALLYEATSL
jgi:hypothetical protein